MKSMKCCGFLITGIAVIAGIAAYILLDRGAFVLTSAAPFTVFTVLSACLTMLGIQLAATGSARNAFRIPACRYYGTLTFIGCAGVILAILIGSLLACATCTPAMVAAAAAVFFFIIMLGGLGCLVRACSLWRD